MRSVSPEATCVSHRDILLQMYHEKIIDRIQLMAGRQWQRYAEEATIQPCTSIAWDQSVFHAGVWQPDGDLTETQYAAMHYRAIVKRSIGTTACQFLDTVLSPDMGRRALFQLYGHTAAQWIERLNYLLKEVAVCFGFSTKIILVDYDADPNQSFADEIQRRKESAVVI
jgi:hypothetical protein